MRNAVVSTLMGDVEAIRRMLASNANQLFDIAHWDGERRGLETNGTLNCFQLAQAMHDALRMDKLYTPLNVKAMWEFYRSMLPNIKRTPYDQFDFIIWNRFDIPGDNPYFDEEDEDELLATGVSLRDICLANFAIQHMECETVEFLKADASPYFLVTTPARTEAHVDKDGVLRHTYFDVAPMLEVTKIHSDDYWNDFIQDNLEKGIKKLPLETIEEVVEGLFDVAACERILYLTYKYITPEVRHKGEEMMLQHLGKIHPILM